MPHHATRRRRHAVDRSVSSACTSCHRGVIWADTPDGHRMPLDPAPTAAGNVLLLRLVAHVLGPHDANAARRRGDRLYMPHFASCPARRARKAR